MDKGLEIHTSLSIEDQQQMIALLCSAFKMQDEKGVAHFTSYIHDSRKKTYLLKRIENNRIIGVICLYEKSCYFLGENCSVGGLSYMGVDTERKDPSIREALLEGMFSYLSKFDLLLGFARKKMDGFWSPYGFLGFTNFGKVSVSASHFPQFDTMLHAEDYTVKYLPDIQKIYNETYSSLVLSLKRESSDWNFFCSRFSDNGQLKIIKDNEGVFAGYLLVINEIVEELCILPKYNRHVGSLLRKEATRSDNGMIELQIGVRHPYCSFISGKYPFATSTRFAWNGGHIVRINHLDNFFNKCLPILNRRLTDAGVTDFEFSFENVHFRYRDGTLFINVSTSNDLEQIQLWQKLIFGVVDSDWLTDDNLTTDKKALLKILFPQLHPQVAFADQF